MIFEQNICNIRDYVPKLPYNKLKVNSRSSLNAEKNSSSPKSVENVQNSNEFQKIDLAEQNFTLTEHNFEPTESSFDLTEPSFTLTEHEFADIKSQTTEFTKQKNSQYAVSEFVAEFISEFEKKTHKSSNVEDEAFKVTPNMRPEKLKNANFAPNDKDPQQNFFKTNLKGERVFARCYGDKLPELLINQDKIVQAEELIQEKKSPRKNVDAEKNINAVKNVTIGKFENHGKIDRDVNIGNTVNNYFQ